MSITVSTMITSWRRAAQINAYKTESMDTNLLRLAQRAYNRVYNMSEWTFRLKEASVNVTTAGGLFSLPEDFQWSKAEHYHWKDSEGREIRYANDAEFYERDRSVITGAPQLYNVTYDSGVYKLRVFPTPDKTYTLYTPYIASPVTLTSATSIALPDAFTDAIEAYFQYLAFKMYNINGRFVENVREAQANVMELFRRLPSDDRAAMIDQPADVYGDWTALGGLSAIEEY